MLPAPTLSSSLIEAVLKHGSPEERRLVSVHRTALTELLEHPDARPGNPYTYIEIGLENTLVLKLNVIARRASPWALIHQLSEQQPQLQALAETVIRHRLHCHAGIKLTPQKAEYELYAHETKDRLLQRELFAEAGLESCGLPSPPYLYGLTSEGELSAYSDIQGTPASELEMEMGYSLPHEGLKTRALLHSRQDIKGQWHADKGGLQFLPFPSHMLNATLMKMNLHFSYLLHRGGRRRYGIIGIKGQRQVFYTTLFAGPKHSTSSGAGR